VTDDKKKSPYDRLLESQKHIEANKKNALRPEEFIQEIVPLILTELGWPKEHIDDFGIVPMEYDADQEVDHDNEIACWVEAVFDGCDAKARFVLDATRSGPKGWKVRCYGKDTLVDLGRKNETAWVRELASSAEQAILSAMNG
jgi:hypothetical protein